MNLFDFCDEPSVAQEHTIEMLAIKVANVSMPINDSTELSLSTKATVTHTKMPTAIDATIMLLL